MNRAWAPRLAAATLVLAAALAFVPAALASITINFESPALADGTSVANQFASQGVTFVQAKSPYPIFAPEMRVSANAYSGTHALEVAPETEEFARPGLVAVLSSTHGAVAVWVRNVTAGSFVSRLQLEAFDSTGNRVDSNGSNWTSVSSSVGSYTELAAASAGPNIAKIALVSDPADSSEQGQRILVDDLTLDTTPAQPPDFAVRAPAAAVVQVRAGASATATIPIQRLNGSAGRVDLAISGLPSGVTASFNPNPAGGDSSLLTLTAALNAPVIDAPVNVTVVGHPESAAVGSTDRAVSFPVSVVSSGADARVLGIEVTQAVQTRAIPLANTTRPDLPVPYVGVHLYAGSKTVVRVFANAASTPDPSQPLHGIPAMLEAFQGGSGATVGSPLPGPRFILPDSGPHDLVAGPAHVIPYGERASSEGGYTFTLPASWTAQSGPIVLRAQVNPSTLSGSLGECRSCRANNTMTLTGVELEAPHAPIDVAPVQIAYTDPRTGSGDACTGHGSLGARCLYPPADPGPAFEGVRLTAPLPDGGLRVRPYEGRLVDVSDIAATDYRSHGNPYSDRRSDVFGRVAGYNWDHNVGGALAIGVHTGAVPGGAYDGLNVGDFGGLESPVAYFGIRVDPVAIVDPTRPLADVAHEFMHARGYVHAGTDSSCNVPYPNVTWPPDGRGDLDGVGLDRIPDSGGRTGTYKIIAPPGVGHPGPEIVDIMSYCAPGEDTTWISVRHWNSWGNFLPDGVPGGSIGAGPPSPSRPTLLVTAVAGPGLAARILDVRPGHGHESVNAPSSSPVRVVVRNAQGTVISSTAMALGNAHGEPGGQRVLVVSGEVPVAPASGAAPGAATGPPASVTLEDFGKPVASRSRSAHAPVASFASMPRRIGGRGFVTVHWQASDADGGRLLATLEYSANGRSYRVLTDSLPADSFRVPAGALSRAVRARFRLSVSDGFNTTTLVSRAFRTSGSAPALRILSPVARERGLADAPLYGSAQAYDDQGAYLSGHALRWLLGRRLLGFGNHVNIAGLTVGRHRIVVAARDRFGRVGRRSVQVIVLPVKPQLVGLRLPSKLKPSARRFVLSTQATVAATLAHGGDRCQLGIRRRRCSFRIKPGRAPLRLSMKLVFGPRTARVAVVIPR